MIQTGSDLVLTKDQVSGALEKVKNDFASGNYMDGLNKIIDEIGELMLNPNKASKILFNYCSVCSMQPQLKHRLSLKLHLAKLRQRLFLLHQLPLKELYLGKYNFFPRLEFF